MELVATQDALSTLQVRMHSAKADLVEAMRVRDQLAQEWREAEEALKALRQAYRTAQGDLMSAVGIGNDDPGLW